MATLIKAHNLTKAYGIGKVEVRALRGLSLEIDRGEFVSIMGPSGSGKTTLMDILGCLSKPTSGTYYLNDQATNELSDNYLSEIRNEQLGFVFQTFNLLPRSTALVNVELPLLYAGIGEKERKRKAREALEAVGLKGRAHHYPNELSGGEQQRVAIARCLAQEPAIFLLDEPTASLDWKAQADILELVRAIHETRSLTTLFVTHDLSCLPVACGRVVLMKEGRIWGEGAPGELLTEENLGRLYDMPVSEVKKRRTQNILA